jgi:tetratricopeptide (TPR) repeat protein
MGIAYYKLKEYQAAIDAFEKAIKIKPDAYENYNSVGAAYIKLFESQLIQYTFFIIFIISTTDNIFP